MKKQLLNLILIFFLLFGLLSSMFISPTAFAFDWIIDGDTVYVNDTNAYLSATPHTITQDTWVTFKLRSKDYEGDIDACWLFDTTNCKPTKPVYYKVGEGDWQLLTKEFTVETIDFENMTKAYLLKNINIQKDINYSLKCFVDIKFNTQGKYWWGVKPSALGWNKGYYIDPWWNSSWLFYRTLTINPTYIDTDLSNFPVLVNISAGISAKCDDGDSIRFRNTDNTTEYYYEIEGTWNATSYNFVWVNITSISSSANTRFLMYYNNTGASDNQSPTDVWDSNYTGVYHLNESSGSTCYDSTLNDNNMTYGGSLPTQIGFGIGYGQDFDGNDDLITIPAGIYGTGVEPLTVEGVFSADITNSNQMVFSFAKDGDNSVNFLLTSASKYQPYATTDGVSMWDDSATGYDTNKHYFAYAYEDNVIDEDMVLFIDDTAIVTDTSYNFVDYTTPYDRWAMMGNQDVAGWDFDGQMDEIRFSNIRRNNSWLTASFHTMDETPGFMTFGLEMKETNVTTNATTGIELTNATVRGFINDVAFSGNYNYGFYIGTTEGVNESNADQNVTGASTVAAGNNFSYNVLSLSEGTHYYDRAWVSNATFSSSENEVEFYTKCDAPTGFTATLDGCNVDLAWTRGTGADKTTIVRKADTHPTNPTDGTVVYNNTGTSYSDTTAMGGHQYYRAWSWTGDKHSDNYANDNVVVPPCPPTSVGGAVLVNNTLNITWTKGTGANTTLVVRKIDSPPSSVTDGTIMYNSTGTHYVATDLTENYHYRLWSYANETYSTSVALDFGALVINCYDEETNDSLYFDVLVRNESGTQSYESRNNTNPLVINVGENLPLGNDIRIIISPASNYSDKTETFTGYDGDENTTVTYIILLQEPKSKALTNVTCRNASASTNSYPAFTLDNDVITILAEAADEFSQITVSYTHYEYDSRTYYRDLIGNHVYALDAFLPDADETELYVLQVIDDYDISVEGADLEIKRSINGTYEIIASPITDANGKASVYLTPDEDHLVRISKTGYETKNTSFIPDPDYYGSYYPIIFKMTAEEPDITTVTFGDLITFTGEWVTANNTLKIYFNDKDDNTTDVTFRVYESYGVYLNLTNTSVSGRITTVTLYFSGLNTSRMHQIRLEMNHTKLGHILNQTIYVSSIRDDERTSESWLDSIIAIVMGDFAYGYVAFALIYCPCIFLIISLGAVKQPGFGVLCAGLYILLVTWRIDLSNTFMVALSSLLILFGVIIIIVKHGKKLTGKESD